MGTTIKGKLPSSILDKPTENSKRYLLMEGLRGGSHLFTEETHLPAASETDTIVIADGSKSGFAVRGFSGIIGSTLLMFRAYNATDPGYLYHLLSSLFSFLNSTTTGTAVPHLDQDLLLKLPLGVPPTSEEQGNIARVLDAVDTVIEQTREAAERTRTVKKALAQHLFENGLRGEKQRKTQIGSIPRSWRVEPVKSVVNQFQYGLSVAMSLKGRYPILRMGNIQSGEILLENMKYINLPGKTAEVYLLKRGDVLFNRTNSQEHVGKVGIYRSDEQVVFASYLIRLMTDNSKVNNYYLGQLLCTYAAQCRIKRYATPGVEQVNINAKNLGRVLIPLPPDKDGLKEQEEIATILEQTDESIRSYGRVMDGLNQLKKSLMHDLLTGKVRFQNVNLNSKVTL